MVHNHIYLEYTMPIGNCIFVLKEVCTDFIKAPKKILKKRMDEEHCEFMKITAVIKNFF